MRISRASSPGIGLTLHRASRQGKRTQKQETLGIKTDTNYPDDNLSASLFRQFGTMHLVAPYLPPVIETDFTVDVPVRKLIGAMYRSKDERSSGKEPPEFRAPKGTSILESVQFQDRREPKAIVLFSAGKDSLWNVAWAQKRFGAENVTAVHVGGLNRSNAKQEREFSIRQAKAIGFPLRVFELHNGSLNSGYGTMRSRDIFLAAITVPVALQLGAQFIITEGFAEAKSTEPFSGLAASMSRFNFSLAAMGIPVGVTWEDKLEMDIIAEMYRERPDWMEHMSNCFTIPLYRWGIRRSWARNAPTLKLHDSQCGSCVKCRLTIVGRILYDNELTTSGRDVTTYLSSTVDWVRDKYDTHQDMIEGSFLRDLRRALELNGVEKALGKLDRFLASVRQ